MTTAQEQFEGMATEAAVDGSSASHDPDHLPPSEKAGEQATATDGAEESDARKAPALSINGSDVEKAANCYPPPASHGQETQDDFPLQRALSNTTTGSPKPPLPLGREIAFVILVCCGQLFTQASLGQAIPILHYMSPTYGGLTAGQLSWIPAAFSLTVGTFIIIAGRVGDMIGHKTLFIAGWVWCSLWALLAGLSAFSHDQVFFDVCRAMQGIGCAMLLPSSLALLGSTYPPGRRKEMVFSIFAATAPNGFLIGAAFAGIFAQLAWWPWVYWMMAIACAVLAVASFAVIPPPSDDGSSIGPQTFDWAGAITGVAGLILFNVAWNQAPTVGWQTPYIIVLLVLGLIFIVAFVLIERRVKQPLLPVSGFSKEVSFVLVCVVLGWSSFGVWLFYFWQFMEVLRGHTPLGTVAQLCPSGLAGIVASLLTGYLLSRWRPELIMLVSLCMFCLGNIFLATMSVDQVYWAETFLAVILTPFGMDMNFPAASLILSNSMPKRHQGIAASLVVTAVNYSISIGLGIGGTVESTVNASGADTLRGYRAALYSGIGLSGLGIVVAILFVIFQALDRRKPGPTHSASPERVEGQDTSDERMSL